MEQSALSNEEKSILKEYGSEFLKWRETDIGKKEIQEHRDHEKYFKLKLAPENLYKITKSELIEVYKQLWASQFWSNKDWKINKILEDNNLDILKKELHILLYDNEIFEKGYDSFRTKIKGFGISTISEILNMVFPEKFCLWNNVTKTVLNFLKLKDNLAESVFKYNYISGEEYAQCIRHITTIKNELSVYGVNDFVDLDMFFWYVHENIIPKEWKKDSKIEYDKQGQDIPQEKKNDVDLEKLILEYDKNKDFFGIRKVTEKEVMQLRSEFISDFPLAKVLDLKIDNYVQGKKLGDTNETNRKTFCYGLEWGLPGFGSVGGGSAIKFGIYYSSKDEKYIYNEKKFGSVEEAYQKILEQIDILLKSGRQFSQDNDWKELSIVFESVDDIKSSVKSKILTVYFPDVIVSINSHNGVRQILKSLFHIPDEEIQEEFILNKKKLWNIKQNHPIMKNWSNFDYSTFVWRAWKKHFRQVDDSLPTEKKDSDDTQFKTKIWVVRAGGKGKEEKDALENNIITIHWNELSDISNFKEKENLQLYYKKMIPNENDDQVAQGVAQVWSFLNEIRKNDIVILPLISKYPKCVAIGSVIDNYEYKEITSDIIHLRKVKWLHKDIPIIEFNEKAKKSLSSSRTVYSIQNQEALESIREVMRKYGILEEFVEENSFENINQKQHGALVTSIQELSQIVLLSEEKLKTIQELLEEKKQIIFYGPPGTSKTYVAKKFSEYFTQNSENVKIIQFHPSYSYEDFIEGIKPKLSAEGEATGFVKQPGIFKNLVDKCIKNPDKKFLLIIDEINRGNISKIFGELIYLLEYRNEKIHLTYSPTEEFYIPENLYIIGTMNSADRSIAFVDYALRRRFYFIEFYPDENILKKWFTKNGLKELYQNNILGLMREINIEISKKLGREYQIGYSYFMNNIDYEKVKRIIDYAIIPLVEQYFFGKKENVDTIRNICNTYLIRLQDLEEGKEEKPFLKDSLESFSS